MRQILRSIFGRSHGRGHIDFWLGQKLDLPELSTRFYHLKGRAGSEIDTIPPLFSTALSSFTEALDEGIVSPSELKTVTTKQLYLSLLE